MGTAALDPVQQLVDAEREFIADAARIRGELRYAHIRAHVEMRELLTAKQVAKYDELRGYAE